MNNYTLASQPHLMTLSVFITNRINFCMSAKVRSRSLHRRLPEAVSGVDKSLHLHKTVGFNDSPISDFKMR